jgi:hypothetical protein
LIELFEYLGIERAHVAAGQLVRSDWLGLATVHSERVASLSLISPQILDPGELGGLVSRLLVVSGDQGPTAEGTVKLLKDLPKVTSHILRRYEYMPWSDVASEHAAEIGTAMLGFLDRHPAQPVSLPEREGETAGISYRVRGSGPPLLLMPLDLAPSQWEPLIPQLSGQYCTITLGGPLLGAVSLLEARGRSSYLGVVRNVLDVVRIEPGKVTLEVGGGSGVVLRSPLRSWKRVTPTRCSRKWYESRGPAGGLPPSCALSICRGGSIHRSAQSYGLKRIGRD